MGQNSWREMMLGHRDIKLVLLKIKDLHGGGEKCRSKLGSGVFSKAWFFYGSEFMARDFLKVAGVSAVYHRYQHSHDYSLCHNRKTHLLNTALFLDGKIASYCSGGIWCDRRPGRAAQPPVDRARAAIEAYGQRGHPQPTQIGFLTPTA